MREGEEAATQAKRREYAVVGDRAEREDRAEPGYAGDLGGEEASAGRDFVGLRLVLRRHAADRIGDARPAEHEAIIGTGVVVPAGEAEFP